MRPAAAVLAALAVALPGCGGEAGDLIAIEGTGGARPDHRIVVTSDGRGRCDGGELRSISSEQLIDAREIERDLEELADESREFPVVRDRRRYLVRTNEGRVRWSEGSPRLPEVLPRAALLELQLERVLC